MNKNVLIMGGTEFVSMSIAIYMIEKQYNVDIFTRGKRSVEFAGFQKHLIGDRHDKSDLEKLLLNNTYAYILDITAYTKEDIETIMPFINRTTLKKYVFCSSAAVYKPTNDLINENHKRGYNENWMDYGYNKYLAEEYLNEQYIKNSFPYVAFRPTYIYGIYNNLCREAFFLKRIINNEIIFIPDSNNKVQFLNVNDLAKTILSSLSNDKAIGEVYNVTNPKQFTWEDMVKSFYNILNKNVNIKKVSNDFMMEQNIKSTREFFPYRDVMLIESIEKLKLHGLHIPNINFADGIKEIIDIGLFINTKEDLRMNKVKYISEALSNIL